MEIQELINHLTEKYSDENTSFAVIHTPKYYKVTRTSYEQTSVYCFIARVDFSNKKLGQVEAGDIFKADSWNSPAKHKRGSLLNKESWVCLEQYGIVYLR